MDPDIAKQAANIDPDKLAKLIEQRSWVPIATVVIWFVVRLLKSDTKLWTIPADKRFYAVFLFGQVSGVLEHVVNDHMTWTSAILGGLISSVGAMTLQEGIIGAARSGKELPFPKFILREGVSPAPGAPPTLPPPPKPPPIDLIPLPSDTTPPPTTPDEDQTKSPHNVD